MVFFLTAQEHKYLINRILPLAREVGVTPELRGWNWWKEPLKPYYSERVSMSSVCGRFCPTARDVYLTYVERKPARRTHEILLGSVTHDMLEHLFTSGRQGKLDFGFESWWEGIKRRRGVEDEEVIKPCLKSLWDLITTQVKAAYLETRSSHPYADDSQLIAVALPFLVEHKLDGTLLGLSGTLSVDCYDYLRHIIFDVKVGSRRGFYRLYPTGYALVFESLYETPVDVGCSVVINFRNDRVIVEKDIFFINDDLRGWWIEERDKKLEIVAQRKDPGMPPECPNNCMFSEVCT